MPVNKSIEEMAAEKYPLPISIIGDLPVYDSSFLAFKQRDAYKKCFEDIAMPLREALEDMFFYFENYPCGKYEMEAIEKAKAALSNYPK